LAATKPDRELVPDAPSILVIETGLLGELLVITPALRALKARWPDSTVTVLTSPGSAPVLVGNPNVDRLLPLSKRERAGFLGLMRLASWIRAKRFDAALVFHTSFRSALVAFLGAVPVRAGLSCEGRGFLLTHKLPRNRSAYEVDEHLGVVGLLGVEPRGRQLELHLTDEERAEAESLLRDVEGLAAGPSGLATSSTELETASSGLSVSSSGSAARGGQRALVCLHPGASRAIRRWPAERFAELGARLASLPGVAVAYAFGPKERDVCEAVARWYEDARLDGPTMLHPRSARVLGAVFECSAAVVTNNTGPMHVAAAVGAPGVFIHGPTPVGRWQPPGDDHVPVFADSVPCRPCDTWQCAQDSLLCMEAVDVDRVFEEISRLLGAGSEGS
jgi:ADP-heptose:LPS heptosyltransferase